MLKHIIFKQLTKKIDTWHVTLVTQRQCKKEDINVYNA
jgi:hypothetical protein